MASRNESNCRLLKRTALTAQIIKANAALPPLMAQPAPRPSGRDAQAQAPKGASPRAHFHMPARSPGLCLEGGHHHHPCSVQLLGSTAVGDGQTGGQENILVSPPELQHKEGQGSADPQLKAAQARHGPGEGAAPQGPTCLAALRQSWRCPATPLPSGTNQCILTQTCSPGPRTHLPSTCKAHRK